MVQLIRDNAKGKNRRRRRKKGRGERGDERWRTLVVLFVCVAVIGAVYVAINGFGWLVLKRRGRPGMKEWAVRKICDPYDKL